MYVKTNVPELLGSLLLVLMCTICVQFVQIGHFRIRSYAICAIIILINVPI